MSFLLLNNEVTFTTKTKKLSADHPTFPCNDVSTWTSHIVARERSVATTVDVHALTSLHGNTDWSSRQFFLLS